MISKKIAYSAMLIALSLIFSYIEALIPFSFGIPGIKLGLANLVVVTGLFYLPVGQVLVILVSRILLVSFLFGGMSSLLYSLAGGLLSFAAMLLLKKCKAFSMTGVSIAGGVCHNIGQLIVAAIVVENGHIFYYLPVLLVSGALTGLLIGMIGSRVMPYLRK